MTYKEVTAEELSATFADMFGNDDECVFCGGTENLSFVKSANGFGGYHIHRDCKVKADAETAKQNAIDAERIRVLNSMM